MAGTTSKAYRIAILTSGLSRGSNLKAIHSYFLEQQAPVEISFVVITRKTAPVADYCREQGLPLEFISTKELASFEDRLLSLAREYRLHLVVLAGFMKKLSANFLDDPNLPVLNIHPALLPNYGGEGFYGMRVHEAVFAAGESQSGVSIHLVDPVYDHGKVLAQATTDVSTCKTPEEISSLVLKLEHSLYAPTIIDFLKSFPL